MHYLPELLYIVLQIVLRVGCIQLAESEVNELDILSIAGDEDIAAFEVVVDELERMDILQSIQQLHHHALACRMRGVGTQPLHQCHSIHILHHDTPAAVLHLFQRIGLRYVRMAERNAQGELLLLKEKQVRQRLAISR